MEKASFHVEGAEEVEDSPIEAVRLTVPVTDDATLPVLTFRTWVLGLGTCSLLAFQNQFFAYRQNPIFISSACAQLALFPLGRWMAAALPQAPVRVPLLGASFSFNPGPFNVKEHVLITLFASSALTSPYASRLISQMIAFYHRKINPLGTFLLMQSSQLIGYGFAGFLMKFLVDNPYMWWPKSLVDVSTYRALHEPEVRGKRQVTRFQFFLVAMVSSFAYYVVPNYFFPSISALSMVCWIWKNSVTAQQIGAGYNGLGLGSLALDWSAVSLIGSPLANPASTIMNIAAGFVLVLYVATPIAYWTNTYNARRFPIFSSKLFDNGGRPYNISRIINDEKFELDVDAYNRYSPINMSVYMPFQYGFGFASVTATLIHVALYNGRSIWKQYRDARTNGEKKVDVHTWLMRKNYKQIPQWWFLVILLSMIGLGIFTLEGFGRQFQLPYWGILLGCALVIVFILPIGVIQATTNQNLSLNIVSEMLISYIYPGRPTAMIAFKSYSLMSLYQALYFVNDFKFGHYMKIPPRSMFLVQIVGTIVSCTVSFATEWWLFTTVKNICNPELLPEGSPWTCPGEHMLNNMYNVWGVVGPARIFAPHGLYAGMYYFFIAGVAATILVWYLGVRFPRRAWLKSINVPVILSVATSMPAVKPVTYWSWIAVGVVFNVVVYKRYKRWWGRYAYVLSSGMDVGVAFMALLASVLQLNGIYGIKWWGLAVDDHCPLAHCPTAPGVTVPGCPAA